MVEWVHPTNPKAHRLSPNYPFPDSPHLPIPPQRLPQPVLHCLPQCGRRNHFCIRAEAQDRLQQELVGDENNADVYASTFSSRPHLFSSTAVFVSHTQLEQMRAVIQAVEAVVALPAYQAHVLHYAPAIAAYPSPPAGVFMGYDFHLGASGPKLIEINSNAGGAFLNAALLRAQSACCAEADAPLAAAAQGVNRRLMQMFRNEWQLQRGDRPLSMKSRKASTCTRNSSWPSACFSARG